MINRENKVTREHEIQKIEVECPTCNSKKTLDIPENILNTNKQLTTISIPKGLVCDHTFQFFIDKKYLIRGYQKIDFEISNLDFHYKLDSLNKENTTSTPLIEIACPRCEKKMNIINDLNQTNKINEILIDNKVLDHCGHVFSVYIDSKNKILGYSNIKNLDENEDLRDIFSKI
ncbi:MAG: hypothetical protein ACFFAO_04795 [Candidatus Hermodarchaeota archaeon]